MWIIGNLKWIAFPVQNASCALEMPSNLNKLFLSQMKEYAEEYALSFLHVIARVLTQHAEKHVIRTKLPNQTQSINLRKCLKRGCWIKVIWCVVLFYL